MYLEFGETLKTKRINNELTLYLDLYYENRRKLYVITLEKGENATEIGKAETPTLAQHLFRTAYFTLKTDENEKGEQDYYGRQ